MKRAPLLILLALALSAPALGWPEDAAQKAETAPTVTTSEQSEAKIDATAPSASVEISSPPIAPVQLPLDWAALGFGLLMAVGAAGAGVGIVQQILLRRARHLPAEFEKDLIHVADTQGIEAALEFCEHRPSSLSTVLKAALLRHGGALYELESAVRQQTRLVHFELARPHRILGALTAISPFVGALSICLALSVRQVGADADVATLFNAALPSATWAVSVTLSLLTLYLCALLRCNDIAHTLESLGIDAVLTLDRKARQSIRLIDDLEEHIKTESAVKIPDLSVEFEEHAHESASRTAVSTHHTSGRGMAAVEA